MEPITLTIGAHDVLRLSPLEERAIPEVITRSEARRQGEVPYVELGPPTEPGGVYRSRRSYEPAELLALARAGGIEELLFDPDYGLLACAPALTTLRAEHLVELRAAHARWSSLHPTAVPLFTPPAGGPPASEANRTLHLLAWLTFWVGWSRATSPHAVIQTHC